VSRALIRFARRRANWEEVLPLEELQEREFKARDGGPDLRPSVYEVDDFDGRVVQTYAEHAYRFDPDRTSLAIDAADGVTGELAATPGASPFCFTRKQHREIVLRDRAELLMLISTILVGRRSEVRKEDVESYMRTRLSAGDEEWAVVTRTPDAKRWLRKLAHEDQGGTKRRP